MGFSYRRHGWFLLLPLVTLALVALALHPVSRGTGGVSAWAFVSAVLFAIVAVKCEIMAPGLGSLGVDAAFLFPLMWSWHSPALAMCASLTAYVVVRIHKYRKLNKNILFDLAQLSLSYLIAGLLWQALGWPDPFTWTGAGALLASFLTFAVLNVLFYLSSSRIDGPVDWNFTGRAVTAQGLAYLGVLPIMGLTLATLKALPGLEPIAFLLNLSLLLLLGFGYRNFLDLRERNERLLELNRQLEFYQQLAASFSKEHLEDHAFYSRILAGLRQHVPYDCATLIVQTGHGGDLFIERAGRVTLSRQELDAWFAGYFDREEALQPVSVALGPSGGSRYAPLAPDMDQGLFAPLQTEEMSLGLLVLQRRGTPYPETSLKFAAAVTSQMAVGQQDRLLRSELFNSLQKISRQRDNLTQILEVGDYLKTHLDLNELLDKVAKSIRSALGFRTVLVSLLDDRTGQYYRAAQAGIDDRWEEVRNVRLPPDHFEKNFSPEFRISRSYFINHRFYETTRSEYDIVTMDNRTHKEGDWHPLDMLLIPLTTRDDKLIGIISVDEPEDGRVPTLEGIQALEVFANQAVTAIENAKSYQRVRELSIQDGLTGVFNHRHFQQMLLKEVQRARRANGRFALMILDIDDFKPINDTYGHPAGDEVLVRLALLLEEEVREMDMLFRYGGEEFAVLFPEMNRVAVENTAERLRKKVESSSFATPEGRALRLTVSIGVAVFPEDGRDNRDLVRRADEALYTAKRAGKNQVRYAS